MPEVITPDQIFAPGQDPHEKPVWERLNPCPVCGSVPHDAPEGVNHAGEPHWVFPHCFKCGYRPGDAVTFDIDQLRAQFDNLRAALATNPDIQKVLFGADKPTPAVTTGSVEEVASTSAGPSVVVTRPGSDD